jgi:hemoglobin/transferrin/lactoferrin receptor protein
MRMPRDHILRTLPVALAAAGTLCPLPAARAGEMPGRAAQPVEQITVVAHKDRRSIRDIAAHVTALSRTDLRDQLATSINDVFRYTPGIDYEAAGLRFGTEGINIRGIGGNRVATLVDGVPLSDQFDIGNFSNATRDFIDAGLIGDIEVLHGPASALYGSSAIGGVVAVRTPDPGDIGNGDALMTWRGQDAGLHGQSMLALGDRDTGLLLGASWRSGEQPESAAAEAAVDRRDYTRRTALAKFVARNGRGGTWRATLIGQDGRTTTDLRSLLGTGRYRSTTALEGDDRARMDLASLAYDIGAPGSLVDQAIARVYYRRTVVEQATLDERAAAATPVSIDRFFFFEQATLGAELNLHTLVEGRGATHRLAFGIEYRGHAIEEYRDGLQTTLADGAQTHNLLGEVFPLRDFPVSDTAETGAFLEDSISFGNWVAIAAVRFDRFELEPRLDEMYADEYPFTSPVALDESDVSPKLGLIYQASPALDLYAQLAHGFRAPPYSDANIGLDIPLFNIRAVPNPELRSESSDGVELGLRVVTDDVDARLTLFRTRYEDFIETKVRLGVDPVSGRVLFQSRNLRQATIKGLEGTLAWRFGGERRALTLDASAYFARGENGDGNAPINSVGPPQAIVGLAWRSADERRQLRLKATLTDDWSRRDESGGELFKPPGYAVFDVFFFQQLGSNVSVRAGLHNLTDRTYWHWADVRGLSPGDPILPYLARAGRSASLSMSFNW